MGYGHLRPAAALATVLGTEVLRADRAPLADARDRATLRRMHAIHVGLSRGPDVPLAGPLLRRAFDAITWIPPQARRGALSAPNGAARFLQTHLDHGFGRGLVAGLRRSGARLVSTYFAQAIAADHHGVDDVVCVVTDSDVNRVWVAGDPSRSRILYCVPSRRTARRLHAYGVDPDRVRVTGFPLPPALLGGPGLGALARNLAPRLRRLDPRGAWLPTAPAEARALASDASPASVASPPHAVFLVGGAGAQAGLACALARSLREPLARGALRFTIVTGTRRAAGDLVERFVARHAADLARGGALRVARAATFEAYLEGLDAILAEADVLWTKPSEMTFFAALGLPVVLAPPIGYHERKNGALARRRGFGLDGPAPHDAARWLEARLASGDLARAAWAGRTRMRADGVYRVADVLRSS
jgi:hypothetical protein